MPVKYLELENFKSYGGHHTIGPFRNFSSVIGPNGSGKSNLMDAISFVLGVQSRDLRSSQMKDLIFRGNKTANQPNSLRASATLVFETDDGEELRYGRTISPAGQGDYRFNGKVVSYQEYEDRLADISVLVKARNFLVFQGDVESLARKSPTELVALMEQISGSMDLKKDYENALHEKEQCEQAALFCFKKQKGFRSERRVLKEQMEEANRFDALLKEKARIQTDMYLWSLYHIDQDKQLQQQELDTLRDELEQQTETERELGSRLKEAKKLASAARRQTGQTDKKRVQLAASMDQLETEILQKTEETKSLAKKLAQDKKQLSKKQQEETSHEDKLAKLEEEIVEYKKTHKDLEQEYEEIKKNAQISLTAEQEAEYQQVRDSAKAASAKARRTATSAQRKLDTCRATATQRSQELSEAKNILADVKHDIKEFVERKEKMTKVRRIYVLKPFYTARFLSLAHLFIDRVWRSRQPRSNLQRRNSLLLKRPLNKSMSVATRLTWRSRRSTRSFAKPTTTVARTRKKKSSSRRSSLSSAISRASTIVWWPYAVRRSASTIWP